MYLLDELERMALNATEEADLTSDEEPSAEQVARWQHLFCYSLIDAVDQIKKHRNDIYRSRVSEEHWKCIQLRKEAEGYDREAYEHQLKLDTRKAPHLSTCTPASVVETDGASYLFKLIAPLSTSSKLQVALSRPALPTIRHGEGSHGVELFCEVDNHSKNAIRSYLYKVDPSLVPTFIRISKAAKNLSPNSAYPTLGIDATLPQHRLATPKTGYQPANNQYPVWYFFYGSLASAAKLSSLLGIAEREIVLRDASVTGGVLSKWGGYKALVDGPADARVDGMAFEVWDEEQEDTLRVYETEAYEVVRCCIDVGGGKKRLRGCTFRNVGSTEH